MRFINMGTRLVEIEWYGKFVDLSAYLLQYASSLSWCNEALCTRQDMFSSTEYRATKTSMR
jgi:hypothetical protein